MKKNDNFNAGATRRTALEEAIAGNFNTSSAAEEKPVEQDIQPEQKDSAARNSKEKFIVAFPMGERNIYKAFCAMQNVSMNHFALCAMDYFKEEVEQGRVAITAHGYKRKL